MEILLELNSFPVNVIHLMIKKKSIFWGYYEAASHSATFGPLAHNLQMLFQESI